MCKICRTSLLLIVLCGCASTRSVLTALKKTDPSASASASIAPQAETKSSTVATDSDATETSPASSSSSNSSEPAHNTLKLTSFESSLPPDETGESTEAIPLPQVAELNVKESTSEAERHPVQFQAVVTSVYQSYPLLQSAFLSRNVALGQQIGATGAFDTKLKGASENGPQGFYQTYRQSVGVVQPTYWGGEVFAGYRIGRGDFQPWYQERETNGAGEFKAGVQVPLARNRNIDARRAELWKAGYARSLAEPDIQAQLIGYVQEASYAYWDWVAAGENHNIAKRILRLAEDRTSRIEAQVKAGFVDPPELTDNLRLVAIRQAKVSDTRRKMEQTASKLSVYWRDSEGDPLVATESQLPGFPEPEPIADDELQADIAQALASRPELRMLDTMRQQIQVDYSEAVNQLQPELNAVLWGSQDVGEPSSKKRDKSPYESEASVYMDVPIQRRKARGKMTEVQGKLAQLAAKRRITEDKIGIDVQMAHAALKSAWEQVEQTRESLRFAEDLAARERQNQEAGASDLLKVTLREQYAVESAEKNVDALKLYFESQADYRAAMAQDQANR